MQSEITWTIQIRKIERMGFIFTKRYNPLTPLAYAEQRPFFANKNEYNKTNSRERVSIHWV